MEKNMETFLEELREHELDAMFNQSGLPRKWHLPFKLEATEVDLDVYVKLNEIKNNIVNEVQNGMQMILYSSGYGNGKTSWAVKLMQNYFNGIWQNNKQQQRGLFIHVPTYLTLLKRNINQRDTEFEKLMYDLNKVDLVIWDDIGATKLSEYDMSILLVHIDTRLMAGKSNIYTTNVIDSNLHRIVGDRLYSRVQNSSTIYEFLGHDRRGES